jgi:hypothetical protein
MAAALGFFEAACAAGDDGALELRAYALAGRERFVEAAQSLDAFLALHPLESLPPQTRARVAQQEPEIVARVASLTVDTPSPGAKVTLNHQDAGATPVHARLAPGRYDIVVTIDGQPPMTRSVDLATGEHTETFDPSLAASPSPTPASSTSGSVESTSEPTSWRPWAIGTAIGAGVLVVGGIGAALWANERSNAYNGAQCDGTSRSGCPSTLSQYNDARDLEITGFVVGGAAAVASSVLWYLVSKGPAKAAPASLGLVARCGVAGKGLACNGTF